MKTFIEIIAIAIMVVASQMAFGQSKEKTLLRTEQLAARLELNDTQKAQLDKEFKATEEARKQRAEKYRALREEMKRDAFVERQAQHERLKEILTSEQLEKLKAMKPEGQRRGKARFQDRRGERMDRARIEQFRKRRPMMYKQRMERLKEMKEKEEGGGN